MLFALVPFGKSSISVWPPPSTLACLSSREPFQAGKLHIRPGPIRHIGLGENGIAKTTCCACVTVGTKPLSAGDRPINIAVILQPLECTFEDLLNSDSAVAICQLAGRNLTDMHLTVTKRGWGSVVVETTDSQQFLIVDASAVHEGNLVGDVRRWTRQYGYQFFVKRAGERFSTPRSNVFGLPDGREIEVRSVFTRAGNFTQWGLIGREVLPDGYVRM